VAVQGIRWDESSNQPADSVILFYGNGNFNHHLGTGFSVHKENISAVKRVEFISDRVSCVTRRGRWCDIIVLNVQAPTEVKGDDTYSSLTYFLLTQWCRILF
jgi:hypothetical protein